MKSATPKGGAPAAKVAPKSAVPDQTKVDPFKYWDDFFSKQKFDQPGDAEKQLLQTVIVFIRAKKFDVAEAVLKGFLKYHGKESEPWMYIFLAECIQARKGNEKELKQTLSYAAHLAKRSQKSEDLIRVADTLVLRGYYGKVGDPGYETNIGELIDQAADKVPTNAWPIMMSVNLASHDKDPKRMADAAERLLSIGWPGLDDRVRRELKQQVNNLEETLRIEGRNQEADTLKARLAESESRDIYLRLTWKGEADIDLSVAEPLGATANYQNFRTVFGGAIIQNGYGKHPEEIYVAPRAFDGEYVVTFDKIVDYDESKPVVEAELLVILKEGTENEKRETYKINLAKPEPIIVKLPKGSGRRTKVLPFIAPPPLPVVVKKPIEDDKPAKEAAKKPDAPTGRPIK